MVNLTADRTRVGPGSAATLTCTVARGNPTTYTYSWAHEGIALTGQASPTLSLSPFRVIDVGNYSCEVMNEAGTGIDTVAIELGGEKPLAL